MREAIVEEAGGGGGKVEEGVEGAGWCNLLEFTIHNFVMQGRLG